MCAASAGAGDGTEKRHRSPAVPFIDLEHAVGRARELHNRIGRDWVTAADAAPAWGLGPKSSASLQTASALIAYGLLEVTGKGRARQLRLSDLAGRLLGSPPVSGEEEQRLLAEMALKPKLIAIYAERWLDGRPANATCIGDLTNRHGFTEKAAARFLEVFDHTMWLVRRGNSQSGATRSPPGPVPASSVRVGDYVQWITEGVDQLAIPRKVIWLSDGGRYLSVEGSLTRLSASEVRVVAPPTANSPWQERSVPVANNDAPAQEPGEPRIVQQGSRLRIEAEVDLAGLQRLQGALPHYRAILALAVEPAEAPEASSGVEPEASANGREPDDRAPFPILGFQWALQHAQWLYDHAELKAVPIAEAARVWNEYGLDLKSRALFDTIDGLLEFGLVHESGSGKARKIRLSKLGWHIFARPDPEIGHRACCIAAGKPRLLAEYAERWRDDRPDDPIGTLINEQGFTEKRAREFMRAFEQTHFFINPSFKEDDIPEPPILNAKGQDTLTVLQRGSRLTIRADIGLNSLDTLGKVLSCYESALELWASDLGAGSESR